MGPFLTSFLFALGAGAWVYGKSQNHTGGITQKSLTAAVVVGVIAFIVFLTIFITITKALD
jgi:hypothetical protein